VREPLVWFHRAYAGVICALIGAGTVSMICGWHGALTCDDMWLQRGWRCTQSCTQDRRRQEAPRGGEGERGGGEVREPLVWFHRAYAGVICALIGAGTVSMIGGWHGALTCDM
jgi:hypothetical protein